MYSLTWRVSLQGLLHRDRRVARPVRLSRAGLEVQFRRAPSCSSGGGAERDGAQGEPPPRRHHQQPGSSSGRRPLGSACSGCSRLACLPACRPAPLIHSPPARSPTGEGGREGGRLKQLPVPVNPRRLVLHLVPCEARRLLPASARRSKGRPGRRSTPRRSRLPGPGLSPADFAPRRTCSPRRHHLLLRLLRRPPDKGANPAAAVPLSFSARAQLAKRSRGGSRWSPDPAAAREGGRDGSRWPARLARSPLHDTALRGLEQGSALAEGNDGARGCCTSKRGSERASNRQSPWPAPPGFTIRGSAEVGEGGLAPPHRELPTNPLGDSAPSVSLLLLLLCSLHRPREPAAARRDAPPPPPPA